MPYILIIIVVAEAVVEEVVVVLVGIIMACQTAPFKHAKSTIGKCLQFIHVDFTLTPNLQVVKQSKNADKIKKLRI